jgi:hemerythrin superfamily protein
MDAIVMLRNDHAAVEKLFKTFEAGDLSVVPRICDELETHAELEEELFYPSVRAEVDEQDDEVLEAVEEHHVVKLLVAELRALDPTDETYRAKATVLMENVRHHIEEEEGEMFPAVRSALGRKRLQEIGARMDEARSAMAG